MYLLGGPHLPRVPSLELLLEADVGTSYILGDARTGWMGFPRVALIHPMLALVSS